MTKTLDYYNENAEAFVQNTINVIFTDIQDRFLAKMPEDALILDFGCGSGRDTKYFHEKGYTVEPIDGSEELCKLASEYTGIPVKHMYFQDLDEMEKYEGIWACSSILHLPKDELKDVFEKMQKALKKDGLLYTSFKYGDFEGDRNGRYFTDFTESAFDAFLSDYPALTLEERWISSDARPGRSDEKWLNVFIRKNG